MCLSKLMGDIVILLEMDLAGPLIKLSDSTSVISSLYVNHGVAIYR